MYTYENPQCLLTFFAKDDGDTELTQMGRGGDATDCAASTHLMALAFRFGTCEALVNANPEYYPHALSQ